MRLILPDFVLGVDNLCHFGTAARSSNLGMPRSSCLARNSYLARKKEHRISPMLLRVALVLC